MKSAAKKLVTRLVGYSYSQLPLTGKDGYDIGEMIKLKAAMDSADYCVKHMPRAQTFRSPLELLSFALTQVSVAGSYLEFGVASGKTINHISHQVKTMLHGFDSFKGLPEDWRTEYPKGAFAQKIPAVNANVKLHVGLFDESLPEFLKENQQPVAFLHIDCDLYSSTQEIFRQLASRIVSKTVIVFDEYFNHATWRQDEWLAFQEFVAEKGLRYSYIGYVPSWQQVCVIME